MRTDSSELRPAPDALLSRAAREGRGRLKVFLGAAPGVGKTWAMLEDAHRKLAEGVDVVAALVETHGRAETEAKLGGLPVLPRKAMPYRGQTMTELDLDALIDRRPALALIDELAHTNVEGSRHEKRWQDVEEVLALGIDVYTTLNIQHIETLNETVARITGVRVRETVPDQMLESADEIELIDLPPDELLERLRAGKIYPEAQAARALASFFVKGNLTALREIAMRAAADQVDAELREHMAAHAIEGPWPTQERILVCVNESPAVREAIRVAKRSADRARAEWIALSVHSSRSETLPEGDKDRLAGSLRLAERLGAELATVEANSDVAGAILDYARSRNVRRIIIGRPRRLGWLTRLVQENVAGRMITRAHDFEVTVATEPEERAAQPAFRLPVSAGGMSDYAEASMAAGLATLAAAIADRVFPVASLSLIFMTAVITVASRRGYGAAILTAVAGFLAYNFFFVDPRYSFTIFERGELLTLSLFLAASLLTGNLAARLRGRIEAQAAIAERTQKLYDFARRVAAGRTQDDVVWAAVNHVAMTMRCQSILLMPDGAGLLRIVGGFPPEDRLEVKDETAAQFAWSTGEAAGHGSNTLPTARWFFLPVTTANRKLAVLGIAFDAGGPIRPVDRRLLDALIDQIALALERIFLTEELSATQLANETERLRTALLSSVSHDLRTPLVTIIGAAGSLAEAPGLTPPQQALAGMVRDEGERLDRFVQNLLDMTRLGHGALKPRLTAVDIAELIGSAGQRLRAALRDHPLTTDLPEGLPLVRADNVLLEQVVVNILDNAAKYAPAGTPIAVSAAAAGGALALTIADQGPGIPAGDLARVFDMFYRAEGGDGQKIGTGLGLAICKGFVEAMGGTIRAEAVEGDTTGARFILSLPLATPETPR